MAQAALGATLTVPTLEGETEVEFAPGPSRATCTCSADAGMPVLQGFRRGDQRLVVDVVVPRRLTDEQRRSPRAAGRRARRRGVPAARRGLLRPASRARSAERPPARLGDRAGRAGRAGAGDDAGALPRGLRGGRRRRRRRARRLHEPGRRGADLAGVRRARPASTSRTAGRTAGARSIGPSRSAGSGSGRRGSSRRGLPAVVIDPGRAFGTGAHPTTRLCIELLSRSSRGLAARRGLRLGRPRDRRRAHSASAR